MDAPLVARDLDDSAILVLAPHPDDEILGAAAILSRAAGRGRAVGVAILTDGHRSDPGVPAATLVERRRGEARAGLEALLGTLPSFVALDHPDGALDAARVDIAAGSPLAELVATVGPDTILVTDPADGHPDHKAAFGVGARLLSAGLAQRLVVMPVSQRVDALFDAEGYERLPVGDCRSAKTAALACHASQIDTATGFSLSQAVRDDFAEAEYVRPAYDRHQPSAGTTPPAHFDALFAGSDDPWDYDGAPYEQDRFRRIADALGAGRRHRLLELGCANGALSAALAPLCDELVATDASDGALDAARRRLGAFGHVELVRAALPDGVPERRFDAVVAADILYYLSLDGIVRLMATLTERTTAGARLVIANYLGPTDAMLSGEMASEIALAHRTGWRRLSSDRTDRLRIDVMERT